MKRKWMAIFMAAVCLTVCSACALPFGNTKDTQSVSFTEEVKIAAVEKSAEDMVAIRVLGEPDVKLIDVMQDLKTDGFLNFTKDAQGMVTAIHGKKNAADWSKCWMLYTSDAELSSTEWGGYDYNGVTLGSASFGADTLPVKKGEVYVWVYTSF